MRPIKFRGKRITDGRWVYGGIATSPQKDSATIHTYDDDGYYARGYMVDPATVGQFTGLTDKNSKEIYEGDIIRSTRNGFGGVVMWHKRGYFYIRENIFEDDPDYNGDYANLGYMLENHPYFEVVGNISDNTPERLKGGEQ